MTRTAPALIAYALLVGPGGGGAAAADAAFGEYLSGECVTCHRLDGQNTGIPSIVGWPADQFVAVLEAYKAKARPNAVMQTIAGRLSKEDMEALAAYYGKQKPGE
jgi:cytochrome c553